MKNHILIFNTPKNHGARYLRTLVEQIRETPELEAAPIQIVSSDFPDGLPSDISTMGVVLKSDTPEGMIDLSEAGAEQANFVVLLSKDTNEPHSDSVNLDILDQLSNLSLKGSVVAECVLESNRARFKRLGADSVIRPIRAYPELMVRAMASPGSEAILEDLFVHAGNHPQRYGVVFQQKKWGELASTLLLSGLGTPLGFLSNANELITNPPPEETVSGKALYIMVDHDSDVTINAIEDCVARL